MTAAAGARRRAAVTAATALTAAAALAASACGGDGDESPGAPPRRAAEPPPGEFGSNVARITGLAPADVAGAALLAAYPPERAEPPRGWVLAPIEDWHETVLAAQFAAAPVNGGLLPIKREYVPTAPVDLLARMRPAGFPRGEGLQALIVGEAGDDVIVELQDRGLKLTQVKKPRPAELAAELVPFRGGWAKEFSDNVVVVSSEERAYALPAAAWSAYSGDTLAFVSRRGVPKATAQLLEQRRKVRLRRPTIYVVGPEAVIPASVTDELGRYGRVKRIAGGTAVETAVEFARFHDDSTGFGWGVDGGPASVSIVNARDWGNAVGAFVFAAAGPQAPLLLIDEAASLPAPVLGYLRELARSGPNQGFAFGDRRSIASSVLRQLDRELERR